MHQKNSISREVLFLFHKKYGRMTVGAWLSRELEQSSVALMLALGAMLTVGGIVVRAAVGSPYRVMLELGIGELVPPAWVMALLWSVAFFTVGAAAGFVLGYRRSECDGDKYKGGMLFVLLAVLELCWYPTFFGSSLVLLSLLETLLILALSLGVTALFYRISGFAGMLLLLHDVWLIYLLVLNASVLLRA